MFLKPELQNIYYAQKEMLAKKDTGTSRTILRSIRLDTGFVLIISGIRRCGKSTLVSQLIKEKLNNSCYFNFEDPRLTGFDLKDFQKLEEIFSEESPDSWYVFDEIQNVPGWEKFLRTKQDSGRKILITGSNATLLSGELGTRLTGRHLNYELFPFSYHEYLKFKGQKAGRESLEQYLKTGVFPEFIKYGEEEILLSITNDILYRDIAVRHGIKLIQTLKKMLVYLVTNTGKKYSYNNLKKLFLLGSPNTVSDYISFFENSFLLFTLPMFSYSIKKQLINPRKIYAIDTGWAGINSLSFSEDSGRQFENLIYLHLRKTFKDMYYFSGNNECDFIVVDKGKVTGAFQTCLHLHQDNLDRELDGLFEALDATGLFKGFIITLDQEDHFEKGKHKVHVFPAWKWLTGNKLEKNGK